MSRTFYAVCDVKQKKLDAAAALEFVSDPNFGAISSFVGRVRAHNQGRIVTAIRYDLFEPLVLQVFRDFGDSAMARFGKDLKLYIAHAVGTLQVGELAVVVAAGSPHRDEAFSACRMAIEAVKHTAPIWKQEHYEDGKSAWSEGCSLCQPSQEEGIKGDRGDA